MLCVEFPIKIIKFINKKEEFTMIGHISEI